MEIKWSNVIAMGLVALAITLALRHRSELFTTIGSIRNIGPGHSPEERVVGLCVLGVIAVTLVVLARILIRDDRSKS